MPKQRYWLLKSEPDVFSIQDLEHAADQTTSWEGVRNYQARNILRDDMRVGDGVLFYHSNAKPPHVAGTATVVRTGYPDHHAWAKNHESFDPRSTPVNPIWYMVDIKLDEVFPTLLPLGRLKQLPELEAMILLQKGSRLSVQPVSPEAWRIIRKLGRTRTNEG
jgi:predicted RNA-binding protein with PUA-like domain